jgi:N-methylhydantoinase A
LTHRHNSLEETQVDIGGNQAIAPLKLLTFDMGGTSTDVALIDGSPRITSESEVGGLPIHIPLLDIHTIGAGGGSIAAIDAGGVLRVGPESAGADPGPACYGRATSSGQGPSPTITDANLFLGRILPDRFLGGEMQLYPNLADQAIEKLARDLNLTPEQTALGIIEIANAHMERALRVISVERGHDPRDFTLLSFGGAGGLHAADLARRLNIPRILISPYASTLSAFGMLAADVVKDYTQTVMLPGDTSYSEIRQRIAPMLERGRQEIQAEGFADQSIVIDDYLDMRYRGQSYELTISFTEDFVDQFHQEHQRTYGYQRPQANLEIVNLRVRASGVVEPPQITSQSLESSDPSHARFDTRPVIYPSGRLATSFYRGESLKAGNTLYGPAIVVRDDTTILIPSQAQATVDAYLNLIIQV